MTNTLKSRMVGLALLGLAAAGTGCGGGDGASADAAPGGDGGATADANNRPPPATDFTRDIVSTALALDLGALRGTATIELAPSETSTGAAFEIGDLGITSVTGATGPLSYTVASGVLSLGLPFGATQIVIAYEFETHDGFDGWDPTAGLTFLWPEFCGNLFPCKSDPADGSTFTLTITGVPDGATAVYPTSIPSPAPSYVVAIAAGAYTELNLGATTAGTAVRAWYLPGQAAAAAAGTANLRDVVDFLETTYGAYSFGDAVGSVSANWGPGAYGGMEHHPYWHVASDAFDVEEIHAHEAAHGWFGNGVRIACWEDFVLSEGLATYLAARALAESGVNLWPGYDCALASYCESAPDNTIALPTTCGAIDILTDPLWSGVPYQKGAQYLREVAGLIGEDELDAVLAAFYVANVGTAANMDDLLDAIKAAAGANLTAVEAAETGWLRQLACPSVPTCAL